MKPLNLEFDQQNWQTARTNWQAWWDNQLERPLVICEGYHNSWKKSHPDAPKKPNWTFAGIYPLNMPVETVLDRYQEILEAAFFLGDGLPKFYVNIGPGVMAALLGARYKFVDRSTWFSPPVTSNGISLEQVALEKIDLAFNEEHPLWLRICDLTRAAVERWGSQLTYGMTDLGGNLDILASLVGAQRLALEFHDHPQEVERLCTQIRHAWLTCYERLHAIFEGANMGSSGWSCLWAPTRMYMLQSDFAYMISPAMFKRFVLPDLEECCRALSYPFYHLDGKGQIRHLEHLLSLEKLRGIQWIPGDGAPPANEWLPLLKRIRDGGKLCQVYVTADGAHKIVNELGGKGFALEIEEELTREQAEKLVEELTSESHE